MGQQLEQVGGPAPPEAEGSLGRHAMHGAFWSLLYSILNKVTTFGGQIVLAWLLLPADFGLIALATSLSSMAGVISVASLSDVLVQEKDEDKFRKDFGQIFWLCNAINLSLATLPMLAAPWIARAYHQPQLAPILILIELNGVFTALALVYGSALKRSLRFKSLASIFFVAGTIQSLVSILMAWLGYGAYAIIVPLVLSSLVALLLQVRSADPVPIEKPRPRLWPGYLAPSFWLLFMGGLLALPAQGTSFLMGFSQSPQEIGLYFWGFSLANQVVFLICNNLRQVFFPTFARLNDQAGRQLQALKKSARVMMSVLAYFCVLQAVTARPLIALIFPSRWLSAAPVVSCISLGMMTQPLTVLYFSLTVAQGLYRRVAINAAVQGALVIACAMAGCLPKNSGPLSAAAWTALGFFTAGLYCGWDMLAGFGQGWRSLAPLLVRPLLTAAACALAGILAVHAAPAGNFYCQLALGLLGVSLTYALAIRLFEMEIYRELRIRF